MKGGLGERGGLQIKLKLAVQVAKLKIRQFKTRIKQPKRLRKGVTKCELGTRESKREEIYREDEYERLVWSALGQRGAFEAERRYLCVKMF